MIARIVWLSALVLLAWCKPSSAQTQAASTGKDTIVAAEPQAARMEVGPAGVQQSAHTGIPEAKRFDTTGVMRTGQVPEARRNSPAGKPK